ncbi:formyltransferase family protein [Pectinatus frisingensis]|uniref:formyltransferase family protein n=1 Tax=Pectinatus frisingensis TaxID=865 RepID=UPI0015F6CE20|nr:formyltransferase family protein [Pectinatus frisingensis]
MSNSKEKKYSILFLTNNTNTLDLYKWLLLDNNVRIFYDKINMSVLKKINPDIIISYNYKYIIDKNIIVYMKNNIVNLHISYLPWNKGSNPNFWSFIDDTPKGVSIHLIDDTLDTGVILFQKKVFFNEKKETLRTSYEKLHLEIKALFKKNWGKIKNGDYVIKNQTPSGSYHDIKEYQKFIGDTEIDYDEPIFILKRRLRNIKNEKK